MFRAPAVADGPQALTGPQVGVDRDPVAVRADADGLEAESVDARAPAGSDEQSVAAQFVAVLERRASVRSLRKPAS